MATTTTDTNIFQSPPLLRGDSLWEQREEPEDDDQFTRALEPSLGMPLPLSNRDILESLSSSTHATTEARIATSFQTIYQHLHEEHYIDRLVNAFYTKSRKMKHIAPSDHIIFENRVRTQFPSPAHLGPTIQAARDQGCDLIVALLSSSITRFRICALAHLFEAALALKYENSVNGVSPRPLSDDEVEYVFLKIQHLFLDMFQHPDIQTSIRRFLTIVYEMDEKIEGDTDSVRASLLEQIPPVAKSLFPCCEILAQEYLNLYSSSMNDEAFRSEVKMLFKFIILSLKDQEFVTASDYITEGRMVISNLQSSVEQPQFKGPSERLVKTLVGLTEQLWSGGMTTERSLAIEQVMATFIKEAIETQMSGQRQAAGGWDVMKDFDTLLRALNTNVVPVPLPSIGVNRKDWSFILDSIVLQFPKLMPSNIHLNSTIDYDRTTETTCRHWHLKVRGIEIEAKHVAYSLQRRQNSSFRMFDYGQMDMSVPADSLDIDLVFTVKAPTTDGTARRQRRRTEGRRPTATPQSQPTQDRLVARDTRDVSARRSGPEAVVVARAFPHAVARVGRAVEQRIVNDTRSIIGSAYHRLRDDDMDKSIAQWDSHSTEQITVGRPRPPFVFTNLVLNGSRLRDSAVGGSVRSSRVPSLVVAIEHDVVEETFIELKECHVRLARLNVDVTSTKHPVLQVLAHMFITHQLRKGLEQALDKTIRQIIDSINESVDQIMERLQIGDQRGQDIVPTVGQTLAIAKPLLTVAQLQPMRPTIHGTVGESPKVEQNLMPVPHWASRY
ncbi:hypothetical protein BGZ94_007793 [Podila epigama]|nr:hypothetical protein BGZ94_007793 [Podila epigama]